MASTILLRGARQLLTLNGPAGPRRGPALGDLGLITDGALLIRDGVIEEAGPTRRVENLAAARGAFEINGAGRVVMPGFVDSHTQLVFPNAHVEDAGAPTREETADLRALRTSSGHRLKLRAMDFAKRMARHGATTIEGKSGYGLDKKGELKMLRVLAAVNHRPLDVVSTYFGARAVPPDFEGNAASYIEWVCSQMIPLIRRLRLARFVDITCERTGFEPILIRQYLASAREHGLGLKMHADRFSRTGGVPLAIQLGATSVDHLESVDTQDIAALAQSRTVATLLPGSGFYLTDRYAPARALIDRGAAVALATDFNPYDSPTYNMQMVVSLACARMKMTAAEAISAATINGAHALSRADKVGSLEPGKFADLLLLNVPDYREIPYHFGLNQVYMTVKKGIVIYKEGGVAG